MRINFADRKKRSITKYTWMTSNFAKNEKELETLIHAVRIYSQDIGMEFSIEKWQASNEKWQTTSDLQNGTTKSRLERSKKRKRTNNWASWKLTQSNK